MPHSSKASLTCCWRNALRDVHRFAFESLSKMKTEADKHLAVALGIISRFPEVAGM